jgi:hypothetical protein
MTNPTRKLLHRGAPVRIVGGPHAGRTGIIEWHRETPATKAHPASEVAVALTMTNHRVMVDPAHIELT